MHQIIETNGHLPFSSYIMKCEHENQLVVAKAMSLRNQNVAYEINDSF